MIYSFCFINRFLLEPKTVLEGEQEQKLKDSEATIASLQVHIRLMIWLVILGESVKLMVVYWHILRWMIDVRHQGKTWRRRSQRWRTTWGSCCSKNRALLVRLCPCLCNFFCIFNPTNLEQICVLVLLFIRVSVFESIRWWFVKRFLLTLWYWYCK